MLTGSRTCNFAHGTIKVSATEARTDGTTITDRVSTDHLLEGMVPIAEAAAEELNEFFRDRDNKEEPCSLTAGRSMSLDGVALRMEVTITSSQSIPTYMLGLVSEEILAGSTCMLHLLDPGEFKRMLPMILVMSLLGSKLGGDMPGDGYSDGSRFDPDLLGQMRRAAADGPDDPAPGTGQYL